MGTHRIQKVLAQAGYGSRRACDELVARGRVRVNGEIAEVGTRVDPLLDSIEVDGLPVAYASTPVVIALNKPWGVVTTMSDDRGRPCVGDLFKDFPQRLFHVGRLDEETEGLLLLTNDGELAHRLMHPSHGIQKTYVATVSGAVDAGAIRRLMTGVHLTDGPATADSALLRSANDTQSVLEITLHEGRNRIVRRMCKAVGHPVQHLLRTRIGGLELGSLQPGEWRHLTPAEIARLEDDVIDKEYK